MSYLRSSQRQKERDKLTIRRTMTNIMSGRRSYCEAPFDTKFSSILLFAVCLYCNESTAIYSTLPRIVSRQYVGRFARHSIDIRRRKDAVYTVYTRRVLPYTYQLYIYITYKYKYKNAYEGIYFIRNIHLQGRLLV